MNEKLKSKTSSPEARKKHPPLFTSPTNAIAPYILLKLLVKMRDQLSTEAMESFTDNYLNMVEDHYPLLKETVTEALKDSDMTKFYTQITSYKEFDHG